MSVVYLIRGEDREAFVRTVFQQVEVQRKATGKQILLKPNIVSHESYPTTTHPTILETCLRLLLPVAKKVLVAEGSAWDAGDRNPLSKDIPLDRVAISSTSLSPICPSKE